MQFLFGTQTKKRDENSPEEYVDHPKSRTGQESRRNYEQSRKERKEQSRPDNNTDVVNPQDTKDWLYNEYFSYPKSSPYPFRVPLIFEIKGNTYNEITQGGKNFGAQIPEGLKMVANLERTCVFCTLSFAITLANAQDRALDFIVVVLHKKYRRSNQKSSRSRYENVMQKPYQLGHITTNKRIATVNWIVYFDHLNRDDKIQLALNIFVPPSPSEQEKPKPTDPQTEANPNVEPGYSDPSVLFCEVYAWSLRAIPLETAAFL